MGNYRLGVPSTPARSCRSLPRGQEQLRLRNDLLLIDSGDHDVANDAVTVDQEVCQKVSDWVGSPGVDAGETRGNQKCGLVECGEAGLLLCWLVE